MNGEALKKRYQIRDAETGEVAKDAYVLRPREDEFAQMAMLAYGRLCTVDAQLLMALAFDGPTNAVREILDGYTDKVAFAPGAEAVSAEAFYRQASQGVSSNGSVEFVYMLWRSMGFEPSTVVMRKVYPPERAAAEKKFASWEREHLAKEDAGLSKSSTS